MGLLPWLLVGGEDERALLSESLLARRIQLLTSVGESESLSSELAELRFFLLDRAPSSSRLASSACVAARLAGAGLVRASLRADVRVDPEEEPARWCAVVVLERVLRELLLLTLGAEVELGLTPFSSRCSGHGFWIACAIS